MCVWRACVSGDGTMERMSWNSTTQVGDPKKTQTNQNIASKLRLSLDTGYVMILGE